jgi:hypothetical protein
MGPLAAKSRRCVRLNAIGVYWRTRGAGADPTHAQPALWRQRRGRVALLLTLVATAACYIPARRAIRPYPIVPVAHALACRRDF